jgi:Na+-driven multidrug efflux pump
MNNTKGQQSGRINLRLRQMNRTLTVLSAPSVVENCLYSLVFLSDTLIVGRLHNEKYLAAAGCQAFEILGYSSHHCINDGGCIDCRSKLG